MIEYGPLIAACATSFAVTAVGTGLLVRILARRGIMDLPNPRSSHERATPRGGGLAVVAAIVAALPLYMLAGGPGLAETGVIICGILILAAVSWVDDVRGLPAAVRLAAQAVCIAGTLYLVPLSVPVPLSALPNILSLSLCGIAWLWFINLYNFMDGIDGITGIETMTVTLGIAAVLAVALGSHVLIAPALIIAAAMPGFLIWNWPPAKIFMGDVGSVTLGYLLGWILLRASGEGFLLPALLIPGYYLADATLTLCRRALRGEKIWQAHRQHAYQHAVQNGMTHGAVSLQVGLLGVTLTGLAVLSLYYPWSAFISAVVITGAVVHHFGQNKSQQPN